MGVTDVCAGQGLSPGQFTEQHPLGGTQPHELGVPDRVDQGQQQAAVGRSDRPVEELAQVLHTQRVLKVRSAHGRQKRFRTGPSLAYL